MLFSALHLWILAMGVVESRDEQRRAWFRERMYEAVMVGRDDGLSSTGMATGPGIGTGGGGGMGMGMGMGIIEEVTEAVLKRFLWIDDLHGVLFRRSLQPLAPLEES
jgi:hypothetical protein